MADEPSYHSYCFTDDDLTDDEIKQLRSLLYKTENSLETGSFKELDKEFEELEALLKSFSTSKK